MTGMNDWWDYLRLRQNNILAHSAKGTVWDDKKYIGKTANGSYIYPKSVMEGWSSYKAAQKQSRSMFAAKPSSNRHSGTYYGKSPGAASSIQRVSTGNRHQGQYAGKTLGRPSPSLSTRASISSKNSGNRISPFMRPSSARKDEVYGLNANDALKPASDSVYGKYQNDALKPASDSVYGKYQNDALKTAPDTVYGGNGSDKVKKNADATREKSGGNSIRQMFDGAGRRISQVGKTIGDTFNRATGGDGFDLGDVRRWASGAVDAAGRAASNAYDSIRGNEAGSTWNRATRGDGHLNTADVTDRIGSRINDAGRWIGDRAGEAGKAGGVLLDRIGDAGRWISDRAGEAGKAGGGLLDRIGDAGKTIGDTFNRATGGDGLDLGDVGRLAGDAGRYAWDRASDAVDAIGRGASNLYDRVRGNEVGSTWDRATRGDDHLNTEDITDRIGSRASEAGKWIGDRAGEARNDVVDTFNRATGGDGFDPGDVRRWANGAVDTAGRAVSDTYDRIRGNEAGSTWNRATRGDGHLNTADVTDRLRNAGSSALNNGRQLFNVAGQRITSTAGDLATKARDLATNAVDAIAKPDALALARHWQERYEASGDPRAKDLADNYMEEYRSSPVGAVASIPENVTNVAGNAASALNDGLRSITDRPTDDPAYNASRARDAYQNYIYAANSGNEEAAKRYYDEYERFNRK